MAAPPAAAAAPAVRAVGCLLLLLVAVGVAQAAQMLSAGDAHWLKVLAPHARSGIPGWAERHEELAAEVAAAAADDGGLDIAVYGDSIMEAWRGQSVGYDDLPRYSANKAAWELNVTSKHKCVGQRRLSALPCRPVLGCGDCDRRRSDCALAMAFEERRGPAGSAPTGHYADDRWVRCMRR